MAFFLIGLLIVFITIPLIAYLDSLDKNNYAIISACIGALLTVTMFTLAVCFKCPAHLLAWLKYDNVVVLKRNERFDFTRPVEQDKVVWQDVDTTYGIQCQTVIMAWDNEKPRDAYEKLVAADSK